MTGVVKCEDANVRSAADLKAVDAAIGRDQPRGRFCAAVDRSQKIKRQIADRSCVRKDGDPFARMGTDHFVEFGRRTPEQMAITLAA